MTGNKSNKLKLYADLKYLVPGVRYVVVLEPFWGSIPETEGSNDLGRFDEYVNSGQEFLELTPLEEADAALLPMEWRTGDAEVQRLARLLAEEAGRSGKKVIIFFNSDSMEDIPIDNAIIFRTSFNCSSRKPNEFALPGWSVDFLSRYHSSKLAIRPKRPTPVVGYCGYIDYNSALSGLKAVMKSVLGKSPIGNRLRGSAVRSLIRNPKVAANFIIRDGCLTGSSSREQRLEYVQNIIDSDYALVVRGGGNFSYRLYEVLSCGRIPLFIDTDCVLPFDQLIDWQKQCVWVKQDELTSIGEKLADFHARLSEQEFIELQYGARKLYEEWISPVGFHRNLWRCVRDAGGGSIGNECTS